MLIIILVIIGFSLLILTHEAGHFVAAKLFGMKVEEFGFGFPPRIFAWRPRRRSKKNETLHKVQGETDDNEILHSVQDDAVYGETIYSVNWLPFGGFVRIAGENDPLLSREGEGLAVRPQDRSRLFSARPAWQRALVTVAGVFVNFLTGWFLISLILMIGTPEVVVVSGVQANSPAVISGIHEGDVLSGFTTAKGFIDFVQSHRGEEVVLQVRRGEDTLVIHATPRAQVPEGQGALGVLLAEGGEPKLGFFSALKEGFLSAVFIAKMTIVGFYDLLKNLVLHGSLIPGIVGPVGIVSVATQTGKIGLIYLVQLLAFIAVNLAVMNLIPFPALDGGRFFLILVEKIKGSPIPQKIEAYLNGFGFAFLIFLIAIITIRDVVHLL